jgi:hypothetical protein
VDMNNGSHLGKVGLRAVKLVIDRKDVRIRQSVDPFDDQSFAALRLEGRAGEARAVAPEPSRIEVAMQPVPHARISIR